METVLKKNPKDKDSVNSLSDIFSVKIPKKQTKQELLLHAFSCYEIIDKMKNNEISVLEGLKEFLINYNKIVQYLEKRNFSSSDMDKLRSYLDQIEKKISSMISEKGNVNEVVSELEKILDDTEKISDDTNHMDLLISNDNKEEQINAIKKVLDKSLSFHIDEVDQAYEKLYAALEGGNDSTITACRGRLIKILKKHKHEIDSKYEDVESLVSINQLIQEKASIEKLKETIQSSPFKDSFSDTSQLTSIENDLHKLYESFQVDRILLYKEALPLELKEHKEVLSQRYSKEFLDKKGTLLGFLTSLPKGIGLAIQGLANSIDELKQAKTNREKTQEMMNVLKASGKLVGTPVLYLGKFLANNWYYFYLLYKGYISTNPIKKEIPKNKNDSDNASKIDKKSKDIIDKLNEEDQSTTHNSDSVHKNSPSLPKDDSKKDVQSIEDESDLGNQQTDFDHKTETVTNNSDEAEASTQEGVSSNEEPINAQDANDVVSPNEDTINAQDVNDVVDKSPQTSPATSQSPSKEPKNINTDPVVDDTDYDGKDVPGDARMIFPGFEFFFRNHSNSDASNTKVGGK